MLKKLKTTILKTTGYLLHYKTKQSLSKTVIAAFKENLLGANLNPRSVDAGDLITLLRKFLNGGNNHKPANYDFNKDIASQAIYADTQIDFCHDKHIQINDQCISVVTPKEFPEGSNQQQLTSLQVNELVGSYKGGINDLEQITSRFLWSCNILLDKINAEILRKASLANLQQQGAKLSNNISTRITALSLAVRNINVDHYLKFIPSIVLFADSEDELSTVTTRVVRLWEKQGFNMQQERHIKHIMFLSSLPFGLYPGDKNKNIGVIDRHFIASSDAIANQLPLQADYKGFGHPVVPFIGRKGQVQGLDIFSKNANNHNFLCCAETGSGKSFVVNWILAHYFASGAKIRINDIGGSYKKIAKMFDGAYIDIGDKNVNLNPFITPYKDIDSEDQAHDLETIVMVLGEMIYSSTDDGRLTNAETGLLMYAVKEAIKRQVVENSIDFIQQYLRNVYEYSTKEIIPEELSKQATLLSFNLNEFTSKGEYGYLFNSVSENTWQDNPFVVLELESLQNKPALMKVITLQVINMMTQEMYQGDKTEKKMAIFDEVAFMFSTSQRLSKVVENGYRRARKYNGSFGTIFQSILDTKIFGDVGRVMLDNAAFKFFLQSTAYPKAIQEGLLNYDGLTAELLSNLTSNRPHYSEIFMDTPGGIGVSRLMVGSYGYAIATTDAEEVAEIENYQQQGMSIDEAIETFANKRNDINKQTQ